MKARDVLLAVLVAVIWGFAFIATRLGLDHFSPPQLTALRFLIAALPAALLPRPPVGWPTLVAIGLTLFTGQFLCQFFGIARGMPPGLAAVVVQTQALFTVLFAAVFLGEWPQRREWFGMLAALVGLLVIAATVGQHLTGVGLALGLASAISWGIGNILVKRTGRIDMTSLMAWLCLVPPLPSLVLSLCIDGPWALVHAVATSSWLGLAAVGYLGVVSTVFAYTIWGDLLRRYAAATVAPFALLIPCIGALASSVVFGERFGVMRLGGMACVLLGLVLIVLPGARSDPLRAPSKVHRLSS